MASAQEKMLSKQVSRRKVLGAGVGLSAAVYAGATLPVGFGKVVMAQDGGAEIHLAWPYDDPGSGGHFNHFVTKGMFNPNNLVGDLLYAPMAMQYWATLEWMPLLATDWSFITTGASTSGTPEATPAISGASPGASPASGDPDTLQVKLREGAVWSDDQPITAKDVVATFDCLWLMSNTVWEYLSDVEAVDDYTINFYMKRPALIVERYVVRKSPLSAAIFGEWAQKARDLRSQDKENIREDPEFLSLLDQFNQFRPETTVVSGPYMFDPASITTAQMNLPKNPKSAFADVAKFDRIVNFNGETDVISAVVLSKEVDYATHGFAPATVDQMMQDGIRIVRPKTYSGGALIFNFAVLPEFGDKKVRQALAKAINREESAVVSLGDSAAPVKFMNGMADAWTERWIDADALGQFNTYDFNVDAATSELQALGWAKDGDTWKKPDGSEATYELMWPSEFADFSATGSNLVEQLNAFGFNVTGRPVTFTQIGIDIDQGKFQLAVQGWGSSSQLHPRFSYETAFYVHNTLAINNGGKGMEFPLVQQTDIAGEVDLQELTVQSAVGMDESAQRETVKQIALVFNELLNIIPLYERFGNSPALEGVRIVAWPPDDDIVYQNSPYADYLPTFLIYEGRLEPFVG